MADSAFKSAPFAAYTTLELGNAIRDNPYLSDAQRSAMRAEIERRARVEAGDSIMTTVERLRYKGRALGGMAKRARNEL